MLVSQALLTMLLEYICALHGQEMRERWERKRHKKNKRLCESVGERKLMRKVESERKRKGRRKR